jgi:hypothetical protein
MILFPAIATLVALACAAFVGWDAWQRPRPERVAWTIAFLVFAIAAGAEVAGSMIGWSSLLTRVYYLSGAVLVVGLLALGELYLLFPGRMPALTPGFTLLVVALAATTVWNAPINAAALQTQGWAAIERGPMLVALAAAINAGGTAVLAGGAVYSAWRLKSVGGSRQRAIGCVLIAAGTLVVAAGGTLTRFGHREFLYIPMALGIAIIFAGILFTRGSAALRRSRRSQDMPEGGISDLAPRQSLQLLEGPIAPAARNREDREAIDFVVTRILPLADDEIAAACKRWSATPIESEDLTRSQARDAWALRLELPEAARARFDALPMTVQAQLGELYAEVWSLSPVGRRRA